MSYKLVHKDILSIKADVIVNAANTKPVCTPGAEMNLYQAAGAEQMLEARRLIGELQYGEAKCTEAFSLRSKYVIHTALSSQEMDEQEQISVIRKCYKNSLALASEMGCKKVAMPIFMLDNYRFPKRKAIDIAMVAVKEFAPKKDMMIYLAVSELEEFVLSDELITRIDELLGYKKEIDEPDPFLYLVFVMGICNIDEKEELLSSTVTAEDIAQALNMKMEDVCNEMKAISNRSVDRASIYDWMTRKEILPEKRVLEQIVTDADYSDGIITMKYNHSLNKYLVRLKEYYTVQIKDLIVDVRNEIKN